MNVDKSFEYNCEDIAIQQYSKGKISVSKLVDKICQSSSYYENILDGETKILDL